jgi:hypothetical protein
MKYFVTICIAMVLIGLFASPVLLAQDKPALKSISLKPADSAKNQLLREVSAARKSGDLQRYRRLVAQLDAMEGDQKIDQKGSVAPLPATMQNVPAVANSPLWGNDALIYSGDIGWLGEFNIDRAADTLGNIYAAVSHPNASPNGDGVYVLKSTDRGATWTSVNGLFWPSSKKAIQGCALSVADTANGKWMITLLFVVLDSASITYPCGALWSCSFMDDGSGWRVREVLGADANTAYRSPALTTDGYYYSPGSTWFYGAAERVTPSTGNSRGIVAFSTRDHGTSWRNFDTTVSGTAGYDDRNPRLGFRHCSYDSLYIAVDEYYAAGDRDVYTYINKYDFTDSWNYRTMAATSRDEYDPDIAVSAVSDAVIVAYTCDRGSGNLDALYTRSTDAFVTVVKDTIAADPARREFFITVSNVPQGGQDAWRVCYRNGADSVMYANGGLGIIDHISTNYGHQKINQFYPSSVVRPLVGAHRSGTSYVGHAMYAGSGPTDFYYDGSDISLDVRREDTPVPVRFGLGQNYPNPFNPSTSITFEVPQQLYVTLKVYNVIGQEVATVVNEAMSAGSYTVTFDARNLSSGTYIYRISAGGFVQTRKMVLLK